MVDRRQLIELGVMTAASFALVAASYGLRGLEPETSVQRASQQQETEIVSEVETLASTELNSETGLEDAQENIPDRPEDIT